MKARTRTTGRYLAAAILWALSLCASLSHAAVSLEAEVLNNGGGASASASFSLNSSIGQGVIGPSSQAAISIYSGFTPAPDSDGDSLRDFADNCISIANLDQLNTDGDSEGNVCDLDDDNDLLSDFIEMLLGTDPLLIDSDSDGLSDYDEVNRDGDPSSYQAGVDTDPNNNDTDGDGLLDGVDPDPLLGLVFADGDLAPLGMPDGIINAADFLVAQRIVLGIITPTALELSHGDVYPPGAPDGVINTSDLILIQQLVFGQP